MTEHRPVPAKAGPRYAKPFEKLTTTLAMQVAIERSQRQPKLISINSKVAHNRAAFDK